jgi:hypothetical protein
MRISTHFSPLSSEALGNSSQTVTLTPSVQHPQEDYLLVSKKFPIFVVADGVTLELNEQGEYPNPSGAGQLAKLFCHAVMDAAEERFTTFTESYLKKIFSIGNKVAQEFNTTHGRIKENLNYWDIDFFAATTAFALIKENRLYWWTLCDAGITVFDKDQYKIYSSPLAWPRERREKYLLSDVTLKDVEPKERRKRIRRLYRNGVGSESQPIGYGVVTGEPAALMYLETGNILLSQGDTVMAYTDGFEPYLSLPTFVQKFLEWTNQPATDTEPVLPLVTQSDPVLYGQERSVIAIQI